MTLDQLRKITHPPTSPTRLRLTRTPAKAWACRAIELGNFPSWIAHCASGAHHRQAADGVAKYHPTHGVAFHDPIRAHILPTFCPDST